MNVQDSYNNWSESYDSDSNATRDLDQMALECVVGGLHFDTIVEAGCGTGKNTKLLARLGKRVQAMDFSSGMLAKAKEKIGPVPNVHFSIADITQRWPCETDSADLVTCNLVLEHVPDLSPVFSEAARALSEGGLFFVSELHPFRQYAGTVANFQRSGEQIKIPAFTHHISDFTAAAKASGLRLNSLQEWWHEKDENKPPRLVTFLFQKISGDKEV